MPHRAVVEERTVSFKLGDLEEAPERERLPSVDLKEETSIDGSMNGAWTLLGDRRVSLCFLYHCGAHCSDLMLLALSVCAFWSWQVLCLTMATKQAESRTEASCANLRFVLPYLLRKAKLLPRLYFGVQLKFS